MMFLVGMNLLIQNEKSWALIARSEACRELALNPLINEVSEKYLSPYCDGYQLHFTSAVSIGPEKVNKFFIEIGNLGRLFT